MKFAVLFLSLLLLGSSDAMSSELQIVTPESLRKEEGYDHRDAIFGQPPYGSTLKDVNVYYADSTLCGRLSPDLGFPPQSDWESPFFLVVDRGDCTFVTKARIAQLMHGAAGVLVADNRCECSAADCISDVQPCQPVSPRMNDDGTGSDVTIPSLLLKKQDADAIKDALRGGEAVQMEVTFDVPSSLDQQVEYELWMNPLDNSNDGHGQELFEDRNWKQAAVKLGDKATFTPRSLVGDGRIFGCYLNPSDVCTEYCTNNGRYCPYDRQKVLENSSITGAQVIVEILRQHCVWYVYGEDGIGEEFWDYLTEFHTSCGGKADTFESFADAGCIAEAMQTAGIDPTLIDKCIDDSGGLEQDTPNLILEHQLAERKESGVTYTPTLFVNEVPVSGRISFTTTFKAICSGFAEGSEPEICQLCSSTDNVEECVGFARASLPEAGSSGSGVSGGAIAGAVIGVLFVLVVIVAVLRKRRKQKNETEANVNEAESSSKVYLEEQTEQGSEATLT
jgi:hypothetical protein